MIMTSQVKQIRGCTEGKGGHAAFASILFSPPATFPSEETNDFYKNLSKLECDVLLVFGKDDPWCTPAFAKRMFLSLKERESSESHKEYVHRYVELDNVGHCPNHEAPTATGHITSRWVKAQDRSKNTLTLLDGGQNMIQEDWGVTTAKEIPEKEISLTVIERLITSFV